MVKKEGMYGAYVQENVKSSLKMNIMENYCTIMNYVMFFFVSIWYLNAFPLCVVNL